MKIYLTLNLAAGESTEANPNLKWVEVVRCGQWDYPYAGAEGGFKIDRPTIVELYDNFKAGVMGSEVPLNIDHPDEDPEDPLKSRSMLTCGWVKDLAIRNGGDSLFGLIDITEPKVLAKVNNGTLKYASAELDFMRKCPEKYAAGDTRPRKVLEGLALTNFPYIKGMNPVTPALMLSDLKKLAAETHFPGPMADASVDYGENCPSCGTPMERGDDGKCNRCGAPWPPVSGAAVSEMKGTQMPKTLEELQAENVLLTDRLSALENSPVAKAALAEAKKANVALALNDVETKVRRFVARGKISPIVGRKLLRLSEILLEGDAATVTLSTPISKDRKYKLAEGDDQDINKLDVIGEVVDMLGQLPDDVAMDASKTELAEDGDAPNDDDEDKELDKTAKDIKASENVTLREAYRKARIQLGIKSKPTPVGGGKKGGN